VRRPEKVEQGCEGLARRLRGAAEVTALKRIDEVLDNGGDVTGRSSSAVLLAKGSLGNDTRNKTITSAVARRAEDVI
jgi:hypothetical protein